MNILVLLSAHFLADIALQPWWVIREKTQLTELGWIALIGHSFVQALVVGTAGMLLGCDFTVFFLSVGITHFLIDLGKIRGIYGATIDQILHFLVLCMLII